ncbi:MAG: (2Fe-2S) ferredoxin domain-containing protein [Nostocaceae cyanobacterium]|nr:(2Fe-2S) ferredoxin domain-containing protein [Nostocaceae cyanobacterium]
MGDKHCIVTEFNLEGQFLGFSGDKPGKVKYLRLTTDAGDFQIKIAKEHRFALRLTLTPGELIRVLGVRKFNPFTSELKLTAHQVMQLGVCPNQKICDTPNKAKILVCQKSGCVKRGGKRLLSELEKVLQERGLEDKATIKCTGCLKRCSKAPNLVVQHGKKEYRQLRPEAIASLLESQL